MIHSIGSLRNLPANINLNSIPDYFKTNQFTTSVGFRCYYPTTINNYPVEKKGLLFVDKIKNLLKLYYFTKDATYISSSIYIGNTIKKLDWFQVVDARHNSIFNNVTDVKKLVTDKDVQTIVDRFLSTYDDTELWKSIEPKFHKDLWNQYANKQDPHIRRANEVYIATNRGVVVRGGNIHTSRRGITVRRPETGARFSVYSDGAHYIVGNLVQGNTHFYSDRKLLLQSRNRPIVQSGDAGNGNREIVIRADLRWKQMYNGRQGLKSIAYPGHAREVIVQLYNDTGGRNRKVRYNFPIRQMNIAYSDPRLYGGQIFSLIHMYLDDHLTPSNYSRNRRGSFRIFGDPQNDIVGRERHYKEYAPMHFIRGIDNWVNQDAANVHHRGDCVIDVHSIGYNSILNRYSVSAGAYDFDPIASGFAVLNTKFGQETDVDRNWLAQKMRVDPEHKMDIRPMIGFLMLGMPEGFRFDIEQQVGIHHLVDRLVSGNVWKNMWGLGDPVAEFPSIRRVWWR